VPAAVALYAVVAVGVWWPRSRSWLWWVVGVVAIISLSATVLAVIIDGLPGWGLMAVEIPALVGLITVLVGYETPRRILAVGPLVGLAQALLLLRTPPVFTSSVNLLVGCVIWSLAAFAAAVAGLFLRYLDAKRAQSVAGARRAQRLELARDLHDFVAHDVSGMIVQAQAAQVVLDQDPAKAVPILQRIEEAGLQALVSLDRTVHMLHDGDGGGDRDRRIHDLDDITELVNRFQDGGTVEAHLHVTPSLGEDLSHELATTAYRVVVEALTNVRRHAEGARRVDVTIERDTGSRGPLLRVSVVNDAPAGQSGRGSQHILGRRGGLGVPALSERVEALGGRLVAGPESGGGWRLCAELPMSVTRRRS
jgi:signal transduction histidine kinase